MVSRHLVFPDIQLISILIILKILCHQELRTLPGSGKLTYFEIYWMDFKGLNHLNKRNQLDLFIFFLCQFFCSGRVSGLHVIFFKFVKAIA